MFFYNLKPNVWQDSTTRFVITCVRSSLLCCIACKCVLTTPNMIGALIKTVRRPVGGRHILRRTTTRRRFRAPRVISLLRRSRPGLYIYKYDSEAVPKIIRLDRVLENCGVLQSAVWRIICLYYRRRVCIT